MRVELRTKMERDGRFSVTLGCQLAMYINLGGRDASIGYKLKLVLELKVWL